MSNQARSVPAAAGSRRELQLADKVAYLRSLLGAGDTAIETHFSWIFLVGDRAWKLRKPARRETMDYSTLAARRHDSEEETRLNRRLAPLVYLGTRPLTVAPDGELAINGKGTVVDWLVEMHRLDRDRMLDAALDAGRVTDRDLARTADLLAAFYRAQPPAVVDGDALEARLKAQVFANHQVLQTLDGQLAAATCAAQAVFLGRHRPLLDARTAASCVIEAHGDLRPGHILLDDPPAVIDCLEFDRNLRIQDRAEELAFLELECTRLGHAATGRKLRQMCLERLNDDVPEPLVQFYRSHRAATRAKLYVWRTTEPDGGPQQDWLATARDYLATALDAAARATA